MANKAVGGGGRGGGGRTGAGRGRGSTAGPRQPAARRDGRAGSSRPNTPGFKPPMGKGFGQKDSQRNSQRNRTQARPEDKPQGYSTNPSDFKPRPPKSSGTSDYKPRPPKPSGPSDYKPRPPKPYGERRPRVQDRPMPSDAPRRGGTQRPPARGYDRPSGDRPMRRPGPASAERAQVSQRPAAPEEHLDRVMGILPVLEMLRARGRAVDLLYIDKEKGGKHFDEMIKLARESGVNFRVVPKEALDDMAGSVRHQGVVAVVAPKEYADAFELIKKSKSKGTPPLIVVLDGVEDPHNLGAILRTAESAGADGVVIPEHRAARLTATVAKVSAGALEHIAVAKVGNLADFIGTLKKEGFWVLGLEGGESAEYTSFDMNVPLAVVMGGEGTGLRPLIKKSCDALVSLPMLGKVDSLNVSVAAGIVLYEAVRQRRQKVS